MRGLIFDCDGVLVDSRESNINYYNHLRSLFHLPPMSSKEADIVHMSTHAGALELILPPPFRAQLGVVAKHIDYNRDVLPLLVPAPGLKGCLDELRQQGLLLGICTNRSESMLVLLEQFGLQGYFSEVMTANIVRAKPAPDGLLRILEAWNCRPDEVVFVGDSSMAQDAASAAGVRFWSFDTPQPAAERHIDSFAQLAALAPELSAL